MQTTIRHGKLWLVWLGNDGTLDTVLHLKPLVERGKVYTERFEPEYACQFRRKNGSISFASFKRLAKIAAEAQWSEIETQFDVLEGQDASKTVNQRELVTGTVESGACGRISESLDS